ncbi:MAG: hypothetical protein Q8L79_03165 [Methylobacter sp.]|nr:hypothetical protein [Methylobacter sp.]MDP1664101.1 hypothetical protein [Methylobacter sp.]
MKSELLREIERVLFWERLRQWCLDQKLAYQQARNRASAKKLERLGML